MKVDPRFIKGLHLFNRGEYFECHEVIEEMWLETPKEDKYRDLYKGVIQAAAAIYQFDRGILSGALGLHKTCLTYLDKYLPEALGLNVQTLFNEMKICFKCFESWDKISPLIRDSKLTPVLEFKE